MADYLGTTTRQYKALENGQQLLTYQQANQLGKLFGIKGRCFYDAALQEERLHTQQEIIYVQKEIIKDLKQQLHQLQKALSSET